MDDQIGSSVPVFGINGTYSKAGDLTFHAGKFSIQEDNLVSCQFSPTSGGGRPSVKFPMEGKAGYSVTSAGSKHQTSLFSWKRGLLLRIWYFLFSKSTVCMARLENIVTIAGTGVSGSETGDNGPATAANLGYSMCVWGDVYGKTYMSVQSKVRAVSVDGIISTFAGGNSASTAAALPNGDGGPATSALFNYITQISRGTSDSALLLCDANNGKLRSVDLDSRIVSLVAGTGLVGFVSGSPATSTSFSSTQSVCTNVLTGDIFSSGMENRIRKIFSNTKYVEVFAGTNGGSSADGVPVSSATIVIPNQLYCDTAHHLYLSSSNAKNVRVINLQAPSLINTVVSAAEYGIVGVWGDMDGRIFVSEGSAAGMMVHRVFQVVNSISTSVAGSGIASTISTDPNGDHGPPTAATLNFPYLLFADSTGSVYIPDRSNCKIRKVFDYSPSSQPTNQPSVPSGQPSRQPSGQPLIHPSSRPSRQPSSQPSRQPFNFPTMSPTTQPLTQPSRLPTTYPSSQLTFGPSGQSTSVPTHQPSSHPTSQPSCQPVQSPSQQPSVWPSRHPSVQPTSIPSTSPSNQPSIVPSRKPSCQPSITPTLQPGTVPSSCPSKQPSVKPSSQPTLQPCSRPTTQPTSRPSIQPSQQPTGQPTTLPSHIPSCQPAVHPSAQPSAQPGRLPTAQPSISPSLQPSSCPSQQPSVFPTTRPSLQSSAAPSRGPSSQPSSAPSSRPSTQPHCQPSGQPSTQPSRWPSVQPFSNPSCQPSVRPSVQPSRSPSSQPTVIPSRQPSTSPSHPPSCQPITQPTSVPSSQPTSKSASQPSELPSTQPSCAPSVAPTGQPSNSPTKQPRSQPSSRPSSQPTSFPSAIPTCQPTAAINFGSFPSNKTISVSSSVGHQQFGSFQIVLPFFFAEVSNTNGFTDVILNGTRSVGTSYVIFGTLSADINLNSLSSLQGYSSLSATNLDFSGRSVSVLDDINGDTYPDLIIGVPGISVCYVLMGTAAGLVSMTQGFTVFGEGGSSTGWSVSGAGDVNGDGFNDIIIGAPSANVGANPDAGAVYVLFGKLFGFKNVDLNTLDPSDGFAIYGSYLSDHMGVSVSDAGDVNGDGFDDVVIGALRTVDWFRGAVYIVYGKNKSTNVEVSILQPSDGFSLIGPVWSWCGYSVSGAGDVNNDTYADIIVGCVPRKGLQSMSEVSYVIYGSNKTSHERSLVSAASVKITGGGVFVCGIGVDGVMVGSDYDFSSGGGYVIFYPELTAIPSLQPTVSPSTVKPTVSPSLLPTTQVPTSPTSSPSASPSDPTATPSTRPTQPTSEPSGVPTHPTCSPTVFPSVFPSKEPTTVPSMSPSLMPSRVPTVAPSFQLTRQPIIKTFSPTEIPTTVPTTISSRVRQNRPTVHPSPHTYRPTVACMTIITISQSGAYMRNVTNCVYVVNASGNVTITVPLSTGSALFIVLPNAHSMLTILYFNVSSDIIDLQSFVEIHRQEQLLMMFNGVTVSAQLRRRSTDVEEFGVLIIRLGIQQSIVLANVSATDVNNIRFLFASPPLTDETVLWNPVIIISIIVCSSLVLIILYHLMIVCRDYLRKRTAVRDWSEDKENNVTLVTYDPNLSYSSDESDESDAYSVELSTADSSIREWSDNRSTGDFESRDSMFMEQLLNHWGESDDIDSGNEGDISVNYNYDEAECSERDAESQAGSEYGSELFAQSVIGSLNERYVQ